MDSNAAKKVHRDVIETRQHVRAVDDLFNFTRVAGYGREGRCASLTAPSGCGKSTAVTALEKRLCDEAAKRGARTPLLWIKVPPNPALRKFYELLLISLNAPCGPRDTSEDRRMRILAFLKKLDIHIIILDEFQHLDNARGVDLSGVCDAVKSLMNDGRVGIIIVGMPLAEDLLGQDEQLLRRRYTAVRLFPFCDRQNPEMTTEEAIDVDFAEFKAVMKLFAEGLGCPDTDFILQDPVAFRILKYTKGTIGRLLNFIEAASDDATKRALKGIDEVAIQATVRRQNLELRSPIPPLMGDTPKSKRAKRKVSKAERQFRSSMGHFRSDKEGGAK